MAHLVSHFINEEVSLNVLSNNSSFEKVPSRALLLANFILGLLKIPTEVIFTSFFSFLNKFIFESSGVKLSQKQILITCNSAF